MRTNDSRIRSGLPGRALALTTTLAFIVSAAGAQMTAGGLSPIRAQSVANQSVAGFPPQMNDHFGWRLATGDFNSAADGSTTLSYGILTAPGRFEDAWNESELGPGYSCCQNSTLTNFPPSLTSRIDLILTRGNVESDGDDAELIGATPFQAAPPLYPSDHAGVVADVEIDH